MPTDAYCGAPEGRTGCGIKITSKDLNDTPSSYLNIWGMSTKVTVRGIEIDGVTWDKDKRGVPIGIQQNDPNVKWADHPTFWRENFVYEKNYIHDVHGEGFYIGPVWVKEDLQIPLRDITIRQNLVETTGRKGIQLKSAIQGVNLIHDNVSRRAGLRGEFGHSSGILVVDGGRNTRIFNNWIEESGADGIQHWNGDVSFDLGPFNSEIFNNVIYDSGKGYEGHTPRSGIHVGHCCGSAAITTRVYNNTIVRASAKGIWMEVDAEVRDNIVADAFEEPLYLGDNPDLNNLTGTISSMGFVDSSDLDFELTPASPAVDSGSGEGLASFDFLGVPRPQGSKVDRGAYEFLTGQAAPRPPQVLVE
jgi:hypothetical protein